MASSTVQLYTKQGSKYVKHQQAVLLATICTLYIPGLEIMFKKVIVQFCPTCLQQLYLSNFYTAKFKICEIKCQLNFIIKLLSWNENNHRLQYKKASVFVTRYLHSYTMSPIHPLQISGHPCFHDETCCVAIHCPHAVLSL